MSEIRILHMYADMLDLYGDGGNMEIIKYRCEKRGIECIIDKYSKAISQAWKESGFKLENIGLLETSGSGFPIEDKIEAEAIADFMPIRPDNKEDTFKNNDQLCALSSTKMVIGHTGAASGLLSLIKAAICLHQQILPAF